MDWTSSSIPQPNLLPDTGKNKKLLCFKHNPTFPFNLQLNLGFGKRSRFRGLLDPDSKSGSVMFLLQHSILPTNFGQKILQYKTIPPQSVLRDGLVPDSGPSGSGERCWRDLRFQLNFNRIWIQKHGKIDTVDLSLPYKIYIEKIRSLCSRVADHDRLPLLNVHHSYNQSINVNGEDTFIWISWKNHKNTLSRCCGSGMIYFGSSSSFDCLEFLIWFQYRIRIGQIIARLQKRIF